MRIPRLPKGRQKTRKSASGIDKTGQEGRRGGGLQARELLEGSGVVGYVGVGVQE